MGSRPSPVPFAAAAALLISTLALAGSARADDARCSAWRGHAKPFERIALRSCQKDGGDGKTAYTVEVKSGYPSETKIRYEVVTADGTADARTTTLKPGVNDEGPCRKCEEHGDVQSFRVLDRARADRAPSAADKEPTRKVKSTRHIDVRARDLRLGETSMDRLERIARRYFEATRHRLVVTGGSRTPKRQAELMYAKLAHGDDIVGLYEQKQAATEIRNAYRDGVAAGLKRSQLVRAVRQTIEAQIARGQYVSRHLLAGAADVRSRGITPTEEQALRAAVADEPGVGLVDERNGPEPHFHLSL